MAKKVADYQKIVINALKSCGNYSKSLDIQIISLASALRTLGLANDEIDTLDVTTILETTRYGKKMAPHPAFKVQRDAQDSVTRQMKALGLTAADISGDSDDDPLVDLTTKVKNAGKSPVIVKRNTSRHDDGK
jgi:hypothetical protein